MKRPPLILLVASALCSLPGCGGGDPVAGVSFFRPNWPTCAMGLASSFYLVSSPTPPSPTAGVIAIRVGESVRWAFSSDLRNCGAGPDDVKWTSANPDVARWETPTGWDNSLIGVAPGETTVFADIKGTRAVPYVAGSEVKTIRVVP